MVLSNVSRAAIALACLLAIFSCTVVDTNSGSIMAVPPLFVPSQFRELPDLKWLVRIFPGFYEDIPYGKDAKQNFNLLVPDIPAQDTIVLIIHGGGFISGDKHNDVTGSPRGTFLQTWYQNFTFEGITSFTSFQYTFGKAGYISVNMNYRLQPDSSLIDPATGNNYISPSESGTRRQIDDVDTVVRFLKAYYPEHHIVIFGHSAGGGLALLYDLFHPGMVDQITTYGAVIDMGMPALINPLLRVAEFSGNTYLKIMQGELDTVVSPATAKEFCALLTVPHQYVGYPNCGHVWAYQESNQNGNVTAVSSLPAWTGSDFNAFLTQFLIP